MLNKPGPLHIVFGAAFAVRYDWFVPAGVKGASLESRFFAPFIRGARKSSPGSQAWRVANTWRD